MLIVYYFDRLHHWSLSNAAFHRPFEAGLQRSQANLRRHFNQIPDLVKFFRDVLTNANQAGIQGQIGYIYVQMLRFDLLLSNYFELNGIR